MACRTQDAAQPEGLGQLLEWLPTGPTEKKVQTEKKRGAQWKNPDSDSADGHGSTAGPTCDEGIE